MNSDLDMYVNAYIGEYERYYNAGDYNSAKRFQESFEKSLAGLFNTSRGPVPQEYYSYIRGRVNTYINSLGWTNNIKIPYLPDYYNSYLQNNNFDDALLSILYGNPYLDTSDIDGMYNLSQSKRDELISQRQQDALKWAAEQIDTYRTNQQNTPLAQSTQMRLAGQNPDLLGTDGVATMQAPDAVSPTPIQGVADYPLQVANTIFDVVGTLATIGLGSANFLVGLKSANSLIGLQGSQSSLQDAQKALVNKNLGLVQSQIESNEVNTLGTLEKVVTDWTLNNLSGDDYDNYVKVKRDEYAKLAVAKGLIKSVDEYIPTPEEEIDLSVAGVAPALSMSDEVIAEKLTGFSPNTISRVKGAYKRINPRSAYFQSRLAEWRRNKASANVDLARMMADPRYSDSIGIMQVLYQPTQKMLKNAFDAEITYKQKSAQYQSELIDAIYKISEQQGELTPEQLAELSLPELQAYQSKMQALALTKQSSYDKMYYGYFADMFQVAEDIRFSNADPAQFEQFMSNWYSVVVPLIKNFSTNSGSVNGNVGANLNLGFGAYYNRSHNTSESTSENKNIDIAKVLQLLGVFGE